MKGLIWIRLFNNMIEREISSVQMGKKSIKKVNLRDNLFYFFLYFYTYFFFHGGGGGGGLQKWSEPILSNDFYTDLF